VVHNSSYYALFLTFSVREICVNVKKVVTNNYGFNFWNKLLLVRTPKCISNKGIFGHIFKFSIM